MKTSSREGFSFSFSRLAGRQCLCPCCLPCRYAACMLRLDPLKRGANESRVRVHPTKTHGVRGEIERKGKVLTQGAVRNTPANQKKVFCWYNEVKKITPECKTVPSKSMKGKKENDLFIKRNEGFPRFALNKFFCCPSAQIDLKILIVWNHEIV